MHLSMRKCVLDFCNDLQGMAGKQHNLIMLKLMYLKYIYFES